MQELHTREIVSKENTKWDTSRCYVGKSYNSFSLEVNKQLCAYSKRIFREFLGFFFEACYLEEKDTLSEFECMEHYSVDAVYIQMLTIIFFQFALNSRYQGTIFVMFSALVSPCPCCY